MNATNTASYNPAAIGAAIDNITAALERLTAGVASLKPLFVPEQRIDEIEFDPKDTANKYKVGGLEKLTERGVEICYRLFDAGKSRYAVAALMDISFGAATHRFKAWDKAGGVNRIKRALK